MPSTTAIRLQIETTLANRVPAALTLKIKQAPELFPTGISEVDAVLGGGVPRGSITEVAGATSTGKTSFGLSTIAAITQSGAACAWVDVSDALSPESAAAANIVLKRLLWLPLQYQPALLGSSRLPQRRQSRVRPRYRGKGSEGTLSICAAGAKTS